MYWTMQVHEALNRDGLNGLVSYVDVLHQQVRTDICPEIIQESTKLFTFVDSLVILLILYGANYRNKHGSH